MKFCTKCGTKLNDDDLFCFNCGTKCAPLEAKEEKPVEEFPPEQQPTKVDNLEKEEEARRLEEARLKEEEEKKRLEEEERRKEEEARLALERKEKEERLAEIEAKRALNKSAKDEILAKDASLREEENKLREELDLPIKEEPELVEAPKVEGATKKVKSFLVDEDEFHSPTLLFHAVIFFAILVAISLIYWLIGAFTSIHVAVRIIIYFVTLGTMALPVYELVKLIIFMIKNKRINLFVTIILGIIQVLAWVFISLNFSAMF